MCMYFYAFRSTEKELFIEEQYCFFLCSFWLFRTTCPLALRSGWKKRWCISSLHWRRKFFRSSRPTANEICSSRHSGDSETLLLAQRKTNSRPSTTSE